jgi:hypothetical protein
MEMTETEHHAHLVLYTAAIRNALKEIDILADEAPFENLASQILTIGSEDITGTPHCGASQKTS